MGFLFSVADWFEGLLRFAFYALMAFGGIKAMGLAKADPKFEGLKMVGYGLLLWSVMSLLGAMARQVGIWTEMPESILVEFPRILYTLYFGLRQVVSGFIDVGAGAMVVMGLSKVAAHYKS